MARVTLDDTASVWSFHLRSLSIGTPRYLTKDFCSSSSLDISKFALSGSAVILSCKMCLVPMSIDVVLATFRDDLLPCLHSLRFSNSQFITLAMSLMSLADCARLVSLA